MSSYEERRTWPCGFQRSFKATGWNLKVKFNDDPGETMACPNHGEGCHR